MDVTGETGPTEDSRRAVIGGGISTNLTSLNGRWSDENWGVVDDRGERGRPGNERIVNRDETMRSSIGDIRGKEGLGDVRRNDWSWVLNYRVSIVQL